MEQSVTQSISILKHDVEQSVIGFVVDADMLCMMSIAFKEAEETDFWLYLPLDNG